RSSINRSVKCLSVIIKKNKTRPTFIMVTNGYCFWQNIRFAISMASICNIVISKKGVQCMPTNKKNKSTISANIKDNQALMKERAAVGVSYDLEFRELIVLKQKVQIYYLNGQVSDLVATEIIKKLIDINDDETNQKKLFEIV